MEWSDEFGTGLSKPLSAPGSARENIASIWLVKLMAKPIRDIMPVLFSNDARIYQKKKQKQINVFREVRHRSDFCQIKVD